MRNVLKRIKRKNSEVEKESPEDLQYLVQIGKHDNKKWDKMGKWDFSTKS